MSEQKPPAAAGPVELVLGLAPERDLVERLRSRRNFMSTDAVRWYMTATPDGDCEEAAAEIERLRGEAGVLQTWINVALMPLQAVADLEDFEDGGEGMNALIDAGRRLAGPNMIFGCEEEKP